MVRFYLRLILFLLSLFTAILLLVHAQPSDDHELREFLLMRGCSAPCFMGITPGETQRKEAVKLLNENPWVKKITYEDDTNLQWSWSGQQPDWINPAFESSVYLYHDTVNGIQFRSRILLGDILITQTGRNRLQQLFHLDPENIIYSLSYPDTGLYFAFNGGCHVHALYLQPVFVNVISDFSPYTDLSTITPDSLKSFDRCG